MSDHERTGKGTGATGGGSFGNLPGEPKTGGGAAQGPRLVRTGEEGDKKGDTSPETRDDDTTSQDADKT